MKLLEASLKSIKPSNKDVMKETKEAWDGLFKVIGGLGQLEDLSTKVSAMTGKVHNNLDKKALVVMCADNGIVDEGVSACPQTFTEILTRSSLNGTTAVAVMSDYVGADLYPVDMGLLTDIDHPNLINKKVAYGSKNFKLGPAMTREECISAIEAGIEVGDYLYRDKGYDILGTGELGIGNTSTSTAILTVLTGLDINLTCGKGAGLTDEDYENKKRVILEGIEINKVDKNDILDVVSKLGGFDIAGMIGLYISAAKNRKPIVVDGFISSVSALAALEFNKDIEDYLIPSHLSKEPGAKLLSESLGLEPILNLSMRLGEGTGCPITFKILDLAFYTLKNMGTFEELNMHSSILVDIRK